MRFSYIYPPVPATKEDYGTAISKVADVLKEQDSVLAIYQFGNFNSPGISDIDLMVVFKENSECHLDPLQALDARHRKLFTHSVMGIAQEQLPDLMRFSFWHNYKLIHSSISGYELPAIEADPSIISALKKQIATEYLTSNYIDLFMQLSTRIIKVRSLLQHVKGFIYDFEFLGYSDKLIEEMVEEVRSMIKANPETPVDNNCLGKWLQSFFPEFRRFLSVVYEANPLYLPQRSEYRYGKNITVYPSTVIDQKHSGFSLPRIFPLSDKKYFRLNNRFNNYQFWFPVVFEEPFKGANERIVSSVRMRDHNKGHFPYFAPLVTRFSLQL